MFTYEIRNHKCVVIAVVYFGMVTQICCATASLEACTFATFPDWSERYLGVQFITVYLSDFYYIGFKTSF